MTIIYYNDKTGGFAKLLVDIPDKEEYYYYDSKSPPVEDMLDSAINEVSQYGGEIDFPIELISGVNDYDELDIFLKASFCKKDREFLKTCLFLAMPIATTKSYKNIKTKETYFSQALGTNALLLVREKEDGNYEGSHLSYLELENGFLEIDGLE